MNHWSSASFILLLINLQLLVVAQAGRVTHQSALTSDPYDALSVGLALDMDADFASLIKIRRAEEPDTYRHALSLISSLKSSASCVRLATATLLTSCQEIEKSSQNGSGRAETSEIILDDLKSIYAAKLAICELLEAGATVPSHCSALLPSEAPKTKGSVASYFVRKKQTSKTPHDKQNKLENTKFIHCLKSLESRPQWWTSYSNSRQNAGILCQAVRGQIERDELLELHKAMTEITSSLGMTLSEALNDSSSHLAKQKVFAEALQAFQRQVQADTDRTSRNARNLFSRLTSDLESFVQRLLDKLGTVGDATEAQFAGLNHNIQRSNDQVHAIHENLGKVFQEVLRSSELAVKHANEWESNQDLVQALFTSLGVIRDREMSAIATGLNGIREQLVKLGTHVENLELRSQYLQSAQDEQLEKQSLFRESFQTDMSLLLDFIGQVTARAMNLQIVVEETSTKFNDMGFLPLFHVLKTSALLCGWIVMPGIAVSFVSGRTAKLYALSAGLIYVAYASGLPQGLVAFFHSVYTNSALHFSVRQKHSDVATNVMRSMPVVVLGSVLVLVALATATRRLLQYRQATFAAAYLPLVESQEPSLGSPTTESSD